MTKRLTQSVIYLLFSFLAWVSINFLLSSCLFDEKIKVVTIGKTQTLFDYLHYSSHIIFHLKKLQEMDSLENKMRETPTERHAMFLSCSQYTSNVVAKSIIF